MWRGIHGHDAVVEQFRCRLTRGRLASSYLLLGPAGIGKCSLALRLAEVLLCTENDPVQMEPCGQCESCRLAAAGNHPDLHQIGLPDGKRTLPVELLLGDRNHRNREGLCRDIAMRPLLGRRRVAIIDDADCFSLESANCLLKTLEEPPPGSVLLLVGTSRSKQLPTILSRSQIVRFAPLSREQLAQVLLQQSLATNLDEALQLADRCDGTLEGASELADPELRAKQTQLLAQFTPERFESTRLATELTALVNQAGKEASARRQRLRMLLQLVGGLFRHVLRASCETPSEENGSELYSQAAANLLQAGGDLQACALAILDRCLEAENQLNRNANQSTLLECWLDDLATHLARLKSTTAA